MRNQNIIVILQYNKFELTHALLSDLARHEIENIDKVLVVDNGSKDIDLMKVDWLPKNFPLELHIIKENIGFVLGFNYGLKTVTGEPAEQRAVFAISNDVRIHGKFIQQTADILFSARRYLVGNDHLSFDTGWNKFNGIVYDYLAGHFLAATSDGWRDIGFFDERFAPNDYEDIDISTTAKKKGYKLAALNNPNIVHQGAGTYGYTADRLKQTERNREVFRKKWTNEN